jgi:hypothetical protein
MSTEEMSGARSKSRTRFSGASNQRNVTGLAHRAYLCSFTIRKLERLCESNNVFNCLIC